MLSLIRKIIPKPILSLYHRSLAVLANFIYRSPSEKLIVIGITGTSGKSTVAYLITKMLENTGYKVGVASTFFFKINKKEWLNDKKMTMLGRFATQKLISQMVKENCQYAIIETSSEGIKQFRHKKINYDVLVFTNLWPEHIEAHGGFENYKNAKLKLFAELENLPKKLIGGEKIQKTIVANLDSEYADEFLNNWADIKYGFTVNNNSTNKAKVVRAEEVSASGEGLEFKVNQSPFRLNILGDHNVSNSLAAICIGMSQNLSLQKIAESLVEINNIPGRIEFIESGQNFKIIVDYAFEPKALNKLYEVVEMIPHKKVIHVLGSTGGGRDITRWPKVGQIAGQKADYVVVTDEDPYDDDPQKIIDKVAEGATLSGKVLNKNLFKVLNRREAINKALQLTKNDDIFLITGKGCEQAIVVKNNKMIPWDDREVVKEELQKIFSK